MCLPLAWLMRVQFMTVNTALATLSVDGPHPVSYPCRSSCADAPGRYGFSLGRMKGEVVGQVQREADLARVLPARRVNTGVGFARDLWVMRVIASRIRPDARQQHPTEWTRSFR